MRNLFKIILSFVIILEGGVVYAQISKFDKVKRENTAIFNYPPNIHNERLKKSKNVQVVYSDREANISYFDAYAQKKQGVQKILQPFFIIGEKNNAYELVLADEKILGKPKGVVGVLLGAKYHFSDPKAPVYVGWIPKSNLLSYNHSFLDKKNNRPLKYKIGAQSVNTIFNLHSYFKKDSVYIYTEPMMKNKANVKLVANQVVYPYKYDQTGKSVLVSNYSEVKKNDASQVFGWISSDLLIPIQHGLVYDWEKSKSLELISGNDAVILKKTESSLDYLYKNNTDSRINVLFPLSLWDHSKNKLINVKGNNLPYYEISRMEDEQKTKNIHLIVSQKELLKLKPYISSLQNIWLILSKYKHDSSNFSFNSVGDSNNYSSSKTPSFSVWLDYIQKVLDREVLPNNTYKVTIEDVVCRLLNQDQDKNFEDNIFLIVGSTKELLFENNPELIQLLAKHSSKLLFIQINNSPENNYQDFILETKSILNDVGKAYNDFIQSYMVDNALIVGDNRFISLDSKSDNIYIYNAPYQSLFNGGIVFPSITHHTLPVSIDIAIDSMLQFTQKTNELLLQSLEDYEKRIGVLRSKPSREITRLVKAVGEDPNKLSRNTLSDVLYQRYEIDSLLDSQLQSGVLLTEAQLVELIEGYRSLLPYFETKKLGKRERMVLKKMYRRQKKGINQTYHRKVLRMKHSISNLFFYKTGIPFNNTSIGELPLRKITRRTANFETYFHLLQKVDALEELLLQNKLKQNGEGDYFVPIDFLL